MLCLFPALLLLDQLLDLLHQLFGFVQRNAGTGSLALEAEDLAALFLRLAEFTLLEGVFRTLQVLGCDLNPELLLNLTQVKSEFLGGLVAFVARLRQRPLHDGVEFRWIRL